jgi:hypothetical protein
MAGGLRSRPTQGEVGRKFNRPRFGVYLLADLIVNKNTMRVYINLR